MATIAALIVGYFSSEDIAPLVETLADPAIVGRNTVDAWVIDNSGDADEFAQLEAIPGIHTLLHNTANLGYGGGMNALARALPDGYDWIFVCNPDIRFQPGSIETLVAEAERHPDIALFGPRLLGDDGVVYPSARAFPSLRTGVGHALFAPTWPTNPWSIRYYRSRNLDLDTTTTVDWLSGACLLVRPEAFALVHGFDEGYFMYFEDVDLAWRLGKLGLGALYVPQSHVVHSGAHSTRRQATTMRKVHHRSAYRYLARKYTGWYLWPVRVSLRFALFVRREFLTS
jgi:N-acetylglucosaminyl-diphospho-decaprenol L-rhamnosyltransferase